LISLLLDQGLPRSAVAGLIAAGWKAVHVCDIGMSRASDEQRLEYAKNHNFCCVTLDADFHTLLAVSNASAPSVIRIRREGLNGTALANLLLAIRPKIDRQVVKGAMVTVTETAIRIRSLPIQDNR
jgi:predicted nuclease of predicted toxin-antitoxin system